MVSNFFVQDLKQTNQGFEVYLSTTLNIWSRGKGILASCKELRRGSGYNSSNNNNNNNSIKKDNISDFLKDISLDIIKKGLSTFDFFFSKTFLNRLNRNLADLRYNPFFRSGREYFKEHYYGKYKNPVSYERFIMLAAVALTSVPTSKEELESNSKLQEILKDPYKSLTLTGFIFNSIEELGIKNVKFSQNVS